MNTALWLKRINVVLFVLVLLQAITALTADEIGDKVFEVVHPVGGALLVLGVAFHLYLNRAWIKATYFKKK
jgi:hypothetical protein